MKPKNLRTISILLLCLATLLMALSFIGCSKPLEEPEVYAPNRASPAGLSIQKVDGFEADNVTFSTRYGRSTESYWGQSLNGFNYIEFIPGPFVIFDLEVLKDGEPVEFKAFRLDDQGNETPVKSTHQVTIKRDQLTVIYLHEKD